MKFIYSVFSIYFGQFSLLVIIKPRNFILCFFSNSSAPMVNLSLFCAAQFITLLVNNISFVLLMLSDSLLLLNQSCKDVRSILILLYSVFMQFDLV